MHKININTTYKKILADIYTPVGIYLRLRDRYRDTILLESTDFHAGENSYSFIGINAIAGIEISDKNFMEYKLPGLPEERIEIKKPAEISNLIRGFMNRFEVIPTDQKQVNSAQRLFGYTAYDAVQFFDTLDLKEKNKNVQGNDIPLIRYRFYQYVIVINHHKDEMFICQNNMDGLESDMNALESLIKNKDVPVFPFQTSGPETSNRTNEEYTEMVKKGIAHCLRGDVFQIVLSRRFEQKFYGDEFNVYRSLRSINPSPYLFYFDYGDYKLIGSSPESQLIIEDGKATMHPIAGTFKRTGDDEQDKILAGELSRDEKENAEHVMLVDLARNDLSKGCNRVEVTQYKKINYYSHVIHLVSEVVGKVEDGTNPFKLMTDTFPAGTLSGAPKFKAMQLINELETTNRSYYGGVIGMIGFDGSLNQAIMIRTFLSRNNTLMYQAGAGIVAASKPENELQEVNNKLYALTEAIKLAQKI